MNENIHPYVFVGLEPIGRLSVKAQNIINLACEIYGVTYTDVFKRTRSKHIKETRQICMYLIKKNLPYSLIFIGDVFGGYDHTTVIHAINRITDLIDTEPEFKEKIKAIEERI